jgi:hypothetical protein
MLSSMESAGAKDMPEEAERKGLGTPATRAATIEKLVQKGFLTRRGDKKTKYLVPTDRGISLITVMPELIQSPTLTADWEQKLVLIERGEYDPSAFMQEIEDMISTLVKTYEVVKGADVLMNGKKVMGACPHCGAEVMERQKGWFCSNKECRFVLWMDNRYFTDILPLSDNEILLLCVSVTMQTKDAESGQHYSYERSPQKLVVYDTASQEFSDFETVYEPLQCVMSKDTLYIRDTKGIIHVIDIASHKERTSFHHTASINPSSWGIGTMMIVQDPMETLR